MDIMRKTSCRMCKSKNMTKFLDLGFSALSDNFLTSEQLDLSETRYPLNVYICNECGLFQLGYVVQPELMFNENYPYDSSTTKTGREHFTSMAFEICDKFDLKENSFVIDVGSNTGVLLSGFKSKGMRVLGIEPSTNVAQIAIENGIETLMEFFSSKLIDRILDKYEKASVITGTNVFAHVDNLDDFVNTCDKLLTEEGVIVIEAPYSLDLLENLEYDTIYHEHLSYLSVKPVVNFFKKFDMEVFDLQLQKIHGGTLRYFVGRKDRRKLSNNISKFLSLEEDKKIYSLDNLKKFAKKVANHRNELKNLLMDLKRQKKRIVGISAPAKGNTLLNYCRIGPEILDYVTEKNPLKIGKYTPGMHIPVYSDDKLLENRPDYALILAWNFADEIIKNNQEYRKGGGKFIVPIPTPKVI